MLAHLKIQKCKKDSTGPSSAPGSALLPRPRLLSEPWSGKHLVVWFLVSLIVCCWVIILSQCDHFHDMLHLDSTITPRLSEVD